MDKRNDFTYDKKNYFNLPDFVQEVHQNGMRYIPILDPGISGCEPNGTYPPYNNGLLYDAFVKNYDGSIFIGKVWNSKCTVFPDFTSFKTTVYWSDEIKKLHDKIPFDGLWIVSCFCYFSIDKDTFSSYINNFFSLIFRI